LGSLAGCEEITLAIDSIVLDSVEDLKIFEAVATLIAERAGATKTASLLPPAQSFVGEIEFDGNLID
jgi:hypothetical protein